MDNYIFREKNLLNLAKDIIIRLKYISNKYLKDCYEKNYQVEIKSLGNFVTDIDKKVENELSMYLTEKLKGSGCFWEEGTDTKAEYNWIIDPIDGTASLIHGLEFAISVALEYNGEIFLGVVHNPVKNITYYAVKNYGSYRIKDGKEEKIQVSIDEPSMSLARFDFAYEREKVNETLRMVEKIYQTVGTVKCIGPASLDICAVAEGQSCLYFHNGLKPWDIAAGKLILLEAGGVYEKNGNFDVFSNGKVGLGN